MSVSGCKRFIYFLVPVLMATFISAAQINYAGKSFYLTLGAPNEDVVNYNGLHITSDSNITVNLVYMDPHYDDGTEILPVDNQQRAKTYYLVSIPSWAHGFCIAATCDSVLLEITPKCNTLTHPANIPFSLLLNEGQTYKMSTHTPGMYALNDLTGTEIKVLSAKADVPVTVFCTYEAIYNGLPSAPNVCCADVLLEQLLPVDWWDTLIPVIPMYDNLLRLKVLSPSNGNSVYFDNGFIKTLNKGEFIDTFLAIPHGLIVKADAPISVTEYMLSDAVDQDTYDGDPEELWCMAPDNGIREGYFKLFTGLIPAFGIPFTHHRLNIISARDNISSVKLNNVPLANNFHFFQADSNWMYASVAIDSSDFTKTYHLESKDKITAYYLKVYYQGGHSFNLSDPNPVPPRTVLAEDTVYKCKGAPVVLNAAIASSYFWSTGAIGVSSVTVTDTGKYSVVLEKFQGCDMKQILQQYYVIDTQSDRMAGSAYFDTVYKCPLLPITLNAGQALTYFWEGGETTSSLSADSVGTYKVREFVTETPCLRTYLDHYFDVRQYSFSFDLGPDTTGCAGDQVIVRSPYAGTYWSTGDTSRTISVRDSGVYVAFYADSCGSVHQDSVFVAFQFCPERYCNMEFPSAFTPNADGRNDRFRPVHYGLFTGYHLSIYNRWGEMVWETYDKDAGWDGNYKGEPADVGSYMYLCQVNCPQKGTLLLKGNVTLLR